MLPVSLKLIDLGHCFVHVPKVFIANGNIKAGAIIHLRSVQTDTEIFVIWNGTVTSGEFAELDVSFAKANNIQAELIVLNDSIDKHTSECSSCLVELVEASDISIVREHHHLNLLDTCRLVTKGLVIPIKVHQHVRVLVKVVQLEPPTQLSLLNQETRMQFLHNSEETSIREADVEEDIVDPDPFISHCLGVKNNANFRSSSIVIYGDHGSGKTHMLKTILKNYKKYGGELLSCRSLRGKRIENIRKILHELLEKALDEQPFIIALDDIDALISRDTKHDEEKGQDALYRARCLDTICDLFKRLERSNHIKGRNVIIISTCLRVDLLEKRVSEPTGRKFFGKIIKLTWPDLNERQKILLNLIKVHKTISINLPESQLVSIAEGCNMFMPLDMKQVVERAIINACSRSLLAFDSNPLTIEYSDLSLALEGYTPISLRSVSLQEKTCKTFDDVGGMEEVKSILKRIIVSQIKYPHVFSKSPLKPQNSILLYGPPGCGKTLIAEALMNQKGINSICVRGPELLSKYIGSSEAAVRDLFKRAELAKPCVIFFDEFESLVSKRGADSTGVTDRVVNQFLTLMDGVEGLSRNVFILAASSRPDMIDPAILRPGRLDKHIYCKIPDSEGREDILRKLSRNIDLVLETSDSLTKWAEELECFTGADIQSLLYSAQLKSLHELISPPSGGVKVENPENKAADLDLKVRESHLRTAFEEMKLEVTMRNRDLIYQYPKSIGNMNRRVAERATLA